MMLNKFREIIRTIRGKVDTLGFPWVLLAIGALCYLPFFWQKGFYWDEAPWTWIYFRLRPEALTKTFSTSRPFWGMVYQITLPLLGPSPWKWQLLMVSLRFVSAFLFWKLLKVVWQEDSRLPEFTALLFLVYPGLSQNFIALMYSHFYIILNLFLLSMLLTVFAIQQKKPFLHLVAYLLSLFHLLSMEYFYFIEFSRVLIIWILNKESPHRNKETLRLGTGYLSALVVVTTWRMFFFTNQNASYSYETIANLKQNFMGGLFELAKNICIAFWNSAIMPWLIPLTEMNPVKIGIFTFIGALVIAMVCFVIVYLFVTTNPETKDNKPLNNMIVISVLVWFIGGGAYWLIGSKTIPQLHFSADRFTLSFMIGASLLCASVLLRFVKKPVVANICLAILVGISAGKQYQYNSEYRHDWDNARSLFWQMKTRIPGIEPGTTFLSNDLPFTHFSDNSLTGILNWVYSDPGKMQTILYFASIRTADGRALQSGLTSDYDFSQNYLATTFEGSTSKTVAFTFSPPGCFRVLDPEIDPVNRLLPPALREAAALSNPKLISPVDKGYFPDYLQPKPTTDWCTFFNQAEISKQSGAWTNIINTYREAQALGYKSNDPLENFPFIEARAHTGDWNGAEELTSSTYKISKEYLRAPLCKLWERISREVPSTALTSAKITTVEKSIECSQ